MGDITILNDKDSILVEIIDVEKGDGSIENFEYEIIPFTLKQDLEKN